MTTETKKSSVYELGKAQKKKEARMKLSQPKLFSPISPFDSKAFIDLMEATEKSSDLLKQQI